MKSFNKALTVLAMAAMMSSTSCDGKKSTAPEPDPGKENTAVRAPHIFVAKTEGYHTFRIPAIAKSNKGTLLAFCEGRKLSGGDSGDINLVLRRSTDGGTTWGSLITVWDDGLNTCGNPSPVVDPVTGRIHLLMTWNLGTDKKAGDFNKEGATTDTRRVWYTYSDDDGVTWAEPRQITSSAKKDDWGWYATGPCHGIVLTQAPYSGRIVIPCDYNQKGSGTGYSHVIYSDDNGANWKIGGTVKGGNESTVAELEDGRLIISCRAGGGKRLIAYSANGGETFSAPKAQNDLPDPRCQAAMLSAQKDGRGVLIHSNCANASARTHLTLKGSTDFGATWCSGQVVWEKFAAYSDITLINEGIIGVLYENGEKGSYERISFEKVPLGYAFIK